MSQSPSRTLEAAQPSDYRLLGLVGQGQYGQVYCAIHRRTGHLVAIKQIRHLPAADQEPLVLARLSHPNVVGCEAIFNHPSGEAETGYTLLLEYCEGGTLRSHLTPSHRCALVEVKALMGDILKGLAHIHRQKIVHGDLKPENILLTYRTFAGQSHPLTAKISDFGIACFADRPHRSQQEIGSPFYAAPERFDGNMSYAGDLYSVGVMLYEMLVGDRPFYGSPDALQQAHKTRPVRLPETLPSSARQLLATALHKQPSQRFVSAEAMLSALQQLPEVQSGPAPSLASLPTVSIKPSSAAFPNEATRPGHPQIACPIEELLTIPQGCCLVTAHALYLLTTDRQIQLLAAFEQAQWSAVSSDGRWCITLPRYGERDGHYRRLRDQSVRSATRPLHFQVTPSDSTSAKTTQLLAIDTRHILRIRTTASLAKTYLECFTRRGQFVAQILLNFPVLQAVLTAIPYQIVAIAAPTSVADTTDVLITRKACRVRPLRLAIAPQKVSALPWGYVITGQQQALLLDRLAEPVCRLADVPADSRVVAIGEQIVLLSQQSSSEGYPTLSTLNLKQLDLGLIF